MLSRPELGVCSWIFGAMPVADVAQRVADLNYDGMVLQADLQAVAGAEARQILQDCNLKLFAVMPENVDLAASESAERETAVSHYIHLLDFAVEAGAPLVLVRGMKGRIRPYTTLAEELGLLETAVAQIAVEAQERGLKVAIEVLNRYESHLLNTGAEAIAFVQRLAQENVGIALNAFHMSIEEQDAATTIRKVGDKLALYCMADSNRQAIGRGHTKLGADLWGMEDIGYAGPIVMECLPPGTDPFAPQHDAESLALLETYLRESRSWF
jgi:sugar phosphate isomerase/epimerase